VRRPQRSRHAATAYVISFRSCVRPADLPVSPVRHGSSPRTQHPDETLAVSRRNGQAKEELSTMGGFGNGMGSLGWFGMGVFLIVLLCQGPLVSAQGRS
jgi:hypothetical protein